MISHDISIMKISEKPLAYSYIRWSTAIQGAGDSYRRQKSLADRWSKETGIALADDMIIDAGVSAFKGKNLKDGALGAFLTAAQEGKIKRGSYLLVESIDRLSRQGMFQTAALFESLWKAGITIVTLAGSFKTYSPDCDDLDGLQIVIIAMRAKEESKTKSERVAKSWEGRYQKAAATGVLPSGNLPAWITKDATTGLPVIDEYKAEIIRRIFDMSIAGIGLPTIAKTLNAEGIKPFAMEKRKSGRSEYWTHSSVEVRLNHKAVFGELKTPKGELIPGIPVIVSREDFYAAHASMFGRLKATRGRKGKLYSNLFTGLAKCHWCGEPMTIRTPKTGRAAQFYCKGTLNGKCHARPWNYPKFEQSFLNFVNEIDLQTIINGGVGSRHETITNQLQQMEGEKQDIQKAQKTFTDMIQQNPVLSASITKPMLDNQTKLDAISERMKALETERNQIQASRTASNETNLLTFPPVEEIDAEKLYALRAKAAQHIRNVVESLELLKDSSGTKNFDSKYVVKFKGGMGRIVIPDNSGVRDAWMVFNLDADETAREAMPKATRTREEFALERSGSR